MENLAVAAELEEPTVDLPEDDVPIPSPEGNQGPGDNRPIGL